MKNAGRTCKLKEGLDNKDNLWRSDFWFPLQGSICWRAVSWQINFLTSLFLEYILKKERFTTTSSSTSRDRSTKIPKPSALTSPELEISHITTSPKKKKKQIYDSWCICMSIGQEEQGGGQPSRAFAFCFAEALCSTGALQLHPSHNPPSVPLHPYILFKFGHNWPTFWLQKVDYIFFLWW